MKRPFHEPNICPQVVNHMGAARIGLVGWILAGLAIIGIARFVYVAPFGPDAISIDGQALSGRFERLGRVPNIRFENGREQAMKLADLRGRPVLINVWATWCAPCVEEMPSLDRLQRDFPDLAIVAINVDGKGPQKVRGFYREIGVKHLEIFLDPRDAVMESFGVEGLPFTMLLDREGREIASLMGGYDWDAKDARMAIQALVGERGGPATVHAPGPGLRQVPVTHHPLEPLLVSTW